MNTCKGLRLDRAAFMLDVGDSARIDAALVPADCTIEWQSENRHIATITEDGVVTAHKAGDAYVRATARLSADHSIYAVASCLVSVGYTGQNPYLPPSWGLFIADGEAHVFDGRMYVYGSRDCPNGYMEGAPKKDWCSDDYHVIWSDDLVHWTDGGVALAIDSIPEDIRGTGTRLWAPDLFRGPKDGRYYLAICTNGGDVFIADGDTPAGPFGNVRRVCIGDEPVKCIDPGMLVDGDRVYIALPRQFFIAELNPDNYASILPESVRIVRPLLEAADPAYYPFEGPSLRKRDGLYYYIYIASRVGEKVPTRMDYMIAEAPLDLTTWRYGGHFIETRDFINAGNIHGSFCRFGDGYYLSYHRMAPGYERFTRMMNLDRLTFGPDGIANGVVRTSSGAKGAFLPGEVIRAASACVFSGGRDDNRLVRDSDTGYAHVPLLAEAWAGYRYVDLRAGVTEVEISYRAPADVELVLTLAEGADEAATRLRLPASGADNAWTTARYPLRVCAAAAEARFALAAPGVCDLLWFRFL